MLYARWFGMAPEDVERHRRMVREDPSLVSALCAMSVYSIPFVVWMSEILQMLLVVLSFATSNVARGFFLRNVKRCSWFHSSQSSDSCTMAVLSLLSRCCRVKCLQDRPESGHGCEDPSLAMPPVRWLCFAVGAFPCNRVSRPKFYSRPDLLITTKTQPICRDDYRKDFCKKYAMSPRHRLCVIDRPRN